MIAGEEVIEGPLDPSAYASTNDTPGIGGARLAVLDGHVGTELITLDDPEVDFANTLLGGNALLAPLTPIAPEPGSDSDSATARSQAQVYTVQTDDTIAGIAAQFNISTNTVLWANGLTSKSVIQVGDHLTILPTTGVFHTVASGDTLLAIANKYDVDALDIASYNGLSDTHQLSIGQKLIVPDGYIKPQTAPRISPTNSRLADGPTPPPLTVDGAGFAWPTTTRHISQYFKWGHTGIDIDNQARPPVYAANSGTVEFAGWLGGYGNLVIVNHGSGISTYYAHLGKFYASSGQSVAKGDAIGQIGSTGRSTGPHVHFEVRKYGRPVNPLSIY